MTLTEYQQKAVQFSRYPFDRFGITYFCLGLSGEVGEVLDVIKKGRRDGRRHADKLLELGDCWWYLAAIATKSNLGLEECLLRHCSPDIRNGDPVLQLPYCVANMARHVSQGYVVSAEMLNAIMFWLMRVGREFTIGEVLDANIAKLLNAQAG